MGNTNPTVVFVKPKVVVLEDRPMPVPAEGQLLIKTLKTLISTGTELSILDKDEIAEGSVWEEYGKLPFYPGYDNIGIVEGVGERVDTHWLGKKVATYGNHARYVTVAADEARLIQREVEDEQAVFFTIAEIVMNGIRRGRVRWGESVVVYGLGLLGHLTACFARMAGARPIIAVDTSDYRLSLLPKHSSIIPVNPKNEDVVSVVKQATRGRMADATFEVTGVGSLIPEEFKVVRRQGRFVVLSSPRGKTTLDFHDYCNRTSVEIIGAHNMSHPDHETLDNPWTLKRDAEFFFDLLADGEVAVEPLISHRAPYHEAIGLYEMLLKDRSKTMGVVLDWA